MTRICHMIWNRRVWPSKPYVGNYISICSKCQKNINPSHQSQGKPGYQHPGLLVWTHAEQYLQWPWSMKIQFKQKESRYALCFGLVLVLVLFFLFFFFLLPQVCSCQDMRDGPKSAKLISLVWVCSFVVILVFVPVETHSNELDDDDDEEAEHEGDPNGLKV